MYYIAAITALTFTVLRLTETIDWSWWWVLAPLWIPTGIVLAIVIIIGIVAVIVGMITR